ncbi:glycosyltransferase family 2 protein [Vagococcus fluvialis]|uniref:glycosyltransferase family 2 protein n=1 Tax=Vagococcus fluvialis TaxID=2738 RepID=UPI0020342ADC|nr:glycosyltransferase family 2 protein [Vagococcus fluvialis]MCM2138012.1 glycosyltransferase [Vagococcus fluvialis]
MSSISYIIPHYDNYTGLKKLLKSIELCENDEIIVVDDCSPLEIYNQIKNLLKEYKFTLLRSESNKGAGHARNIGIEKSISEWIIFADADDIFIEGYSSILEKYLNNNFDIVYFSPTSKKVSTNNSVIGNRHSFYSFLVNKYAESPTLKNKNNMIYKMVVPWSKLIRRDLIKNNSISFDVVEVSNDVMFSTKIGFYSDNVIATNESIYCCIEMENSLTADISFTKTMQRLIIFSNQYNFLRESLNKSEFQKLSITGFSYLYLAKKNDYSYSEKKEIKLFLKKNRIPIITVAYLFNRIQRLFNK